MKELIRKLGRRVLGVLSGFDRLLFRGFLPCVISARGLNGYLYGAKVAMTDFEDHAKQVTKTVIDQSLARPHSSGVEMKYIDNSYTRKQDVAKDIAHRKGITTGPVCVLSAVEPCMSFVLRRDKGTQTIWLERRRRKCLHLYHYFLDKRFGFMHVRLQTWFPFTIQVCLNGREWLARSLETAGIDYVRRDNCISRVADIALAQRLLNDQRRLNWQAALDDLRRLVHPAHETVFANCPADARHYYWTVAESEWASDVLFRDPQEVSPLCQRLADHSLRVHGAGDVMRFLSRIPRADGMPRATFGGEIQSDVRTFEQGGRIKHRLNANSVKMYNRPGVLRFETTINNTGEFKVFRTTATNPNGPPAWLRLRKGIADLHRRTEVSQLANNRLATAQAAALDEQQRLKELAASLCSRVRRPGRRKSDGTLTQPRNFRALNPLSTQDIELLTLVSRGEFVIAGFRNRDLRTLLHGADPADRVEQRRRASKVSRQLSLLRAHGIIEKISKSHHYRVTTKGRQSLTAILAAANATTQTLTKLAA